jgi:outer membrane protein assembly factor BamB
MYLKSTLRTVLIMYCVLISPMLLAQDMQTPKWSLDLDGDVKWLKQTSTGMLIAYSGKGLFGIDPETRKIAWQKKWNDSVKDVLLTNKLTADAFQEIEGTPFARIQEAGDDMLVKSQTSIINFMTGEDIFTSKGTKMTIAENTPMFGIGAMLLQIRQEKKDYLVLVDVATGQERWRTELVGIKHYGLLSIKGNIAKAKKMLGINQNAVPRLDKDGNILYPQGETLSRIDGKTGKTLWNTKLDDKVGRLEFSEKGDVVYTGAGKYIMGYSIDKGEATWKDPYKVPGKFKYFVPMAQATLLAVTENGITRIDEATGKSVWKKPNYVDLPLQTVEFLQNGMLVLSSSAKESQFDYIDYNGKDLWRKSYKTDKPVTTYEITDKGLLFANAEEANVIDFQDGRDDIWKRRIKLRGTPIVSIDRPRSTMLIYSNDKLYTVNLNDLSNKLLAEDIKFKGSDEDVEVIEARKDGYLLSSSQNMWFISHDGKALYNKFYREPGAGKRALAMLGQAASAYGAVAGTMNVGMNAAMAGGNSIMGNEAAANANLRSANNAYSVAVVSANANAAFTTMYEKRYKATFITQNTQFILAGIELDGVKRTGLMKINKDTGAEMGKIMLKDLTPIYVVDDVANSLHVIIDANKFFSYEL